MADSLGLYVHIPFCVKKCAYCDFYSITKTEMQDAYIDALVAQIKSRKNEARRFVADTIYIGGGTPSLLTQENFEKLFEALHYVFKIAPSAEITVEANPGTIDSAKLALYRSLGVNRLSIGFQSANAAELKVLSRIHTKEDFENSYIFARMEGFNNINVDLMYALPGQTQAALDRTLDYVLSLTPEHVSFYGLKIEENTPFYNNPLIMSKIPQEDTQYKMYMSAAKTLEAAGLRQYEISNFARPGKECAHNIKYWKCREYMGFGVAAHSFVAGEMYSYFKNIEKFIASPTEHESLLESRAHLSKKELATQYTMLGFRLRDGVDATEYKKISGEDFESSYLEKMTPFIEKKFITKNPLGYRLTRRGMLISNYILSEILDFGD